MPPGLGDAATSWETHRDLVYGTLPRAKQIAASTSLSFLVLSVDTRS
jgi:hypothetical protein